MGRRLRGAKGSLIILGMKSSWSALGTPYLPPLDETGNVKLP